MRLHPLLQDSVLLFVAAPQQLGRRAAVLPCMAPEGLPLGLGFPDQLGHFCLGKGVNLLPTPMAGGMLGEKRDTYQESIVSKVCLIADCVAGTLSPQYYRQVQFT